MVSKLFCKRSHRNQRQIYQWRCNKIENILAEICCRGIKFEGELIAETQKIRKSLMLQNFYGTFRNHWQDKDKRLLGRISNGKLWFFKTEKPITDGKLKELNPFIDDWERLHISGHFKQEQYHMKASIKTSYPTNTTQAHLLRGTHNHGYMRTEFVLSTLRQNYFFVKKDHKQVFLL